MRAINYILAGILLAGCPAHKPEESTGKIKTYRTGNIAVQIEDDSTYLSVRGHKFVEFQEEADVYLFDKENNSSFEKALVRLKRKECVKETQYGEIMSEGLGREALRFLGERSIEEFSRGQTIKITYEKLIPEFERLKAENK